MDKFDGLVVQTDPANQRKKFAEIGGQRWEVLLFSTGDIWSIERQVRAGSAVLENSQSGFRSSVKLASPARTEIEWWKTFPTLEEAAAAAENHVWEVKKQANLDWYETYEEHWVAAVGEGDFIEIFTVGDEKRFVVKRSISPCEGESYEISVSRYDIYRGSKRAITTFSEAVAVALTLPTFVMALATNPQQT